MGFRFDSASKVPETEVPEQQGMRAQSGWESSTAHEPSPEAGGVRPAP